MKGIFENGQRIRAILSVECKVVTAREAIGAQGACFSRQIQSNGSPNAEMSSHGILFLANSLAKQKSLRREQEENSATPSDCPANDSSD